MIVPSQACTVLLAYSKSNKLTMLAELDLDTLDFPRIESLPGGSTLFVVLFLHPKRRILRYVEVTSAESSLGHKNPLQSSQL